MLDFTIIQQFLCGFVVGLASSITVGPVAVMVIQRTLSNSRGSGLVSGIGVACADTSMAVIAFFCYSMLESLISQYTDILSIVGGTVVMIMGVYIFLHNPMSQIRRNRTGKSMLVQDFISIFSFTLTFFYVIIPYLLAFFSMFGSISGGEESSIAGSIMVIAGFFIGAVAWWMSLTMLLSIFRRKIKPRHMVIINRVAGVIVLLIGVYTLLSTLIKIILNGM